MSLTGSLPTVAHSPASAGWSAGTPRSRRRGSSIARVTLCRYDQPRL